MGTALCSGVLLFAGAARAEQAPLREAPDGRKLVLTFADDFDSFRQWGLPNGVWRTTFGAGNQEGLTRRSLPNNDELEIYVDPLLADAHGPIGLDPFSIQGGKLVIRAWPTPESLRDRLDGYPYVSGMISSQPTFWQLYGYFEMRAKIPDGKGVWPAFWLLPADQSWPPEIDVMESVSDASTVYSTTHSSVQPKVGVKAHITPDAFHTYAVSWDNSTITFYVDGRQIGSQPTPPDFHKPMYMVANLAIGGNWPGNPDATTRFPKRLTIDYIRAYRFADEQ